MSVASQSPEPQAQRQAYGLDFASWLLLSTAVLAGVAGPAARFRALGPAEPVIGPSLLLQPDCPRLRLLLGRLLNEPLELQNSLVRQSSGLRGDLLEHAKFGGPLPTLHSDMSLPRGFRESYSAMLESRNDDFNPEPDRIDALLRPMFLLTNPAHGISDSLVANCHAGQTLVSMLLEKPLPTVERQALLRLLNGTMVESDTKRSKARVHQVAGGQIQSLRASIIFQANAISLKALAMDTELAAAFVMAVPAASGSKPERLLAGGYYADAIRQVVDARRTGTFVEAQMRNRAKAMAFSQQHLEFLEDVENANDPALTAFASLPMALGWALRLLYPRSKEPDELILKHAVPVAHTLMQRQQKVLERLRKAEAFAKKARDKARLVRRIGKGGPMTRRQVARGLQQQSQAQYGQLLQELIEDGVVKVDGKLLELASAHKPATARY